MKTLHRVSLSIPALAFLLFPANARAQDASSAVLNALDVQQLVKRSEPADNARLAAHFTALAERSAADAKRHTAMGQAYDVNGGRRASTNPAAHCARLAELATQSATTLRALATYHEGVGAGGTPRAPKDGARFQAGEGALSPSERDLLGLAAQAKTPADHRALEQYYLTLSTTYRDDAKDHLAMAGAYRGNANRRGGDPAVHCDRIVTLSREAAKEATDAAAMHRQLAGVAR